MKTIQEISLFVIFEKVVCDRFVLPSSILNVWLKNRLDRNRKQFQKLQ